MKGISGTVGKIKDGEEWVFLFDPGALTLYADIVTEMHESSGIVRMSFAAISTNGDGVHKANIVVRLRMPKDVAWSLCRELRAMEGGH